MFKTIRMYGYLFLIQLYLTYYINKKVLQNKIFINEVWYGIILYLIFGILFIYISYRIYIKQVNKQLDNLKNNTFNFNKRNKVSPWLKIIYLFLIAIPISLSYYVDHKTNYIYSISDFERISDNPDGYYIIKKDLDFTHKKPSNEYYYWCSDSAFNGTLDGKGHTIKNVRETLFFCTSSESVIKNLNLSDVNIKGRYADYTGVISNTNYGLILNVHIRGTINAFDNTGGIVGDNGGIIDRSSFIGSINGLNYVGGLIGHNTGQLMNSYAVIDIQGKKEVGGLIGNNSFYPHEGYNLFAYGSVTGDINVGGLFGITQGDVSNAYSNVSVNGKEQVGGIAGFSIGSQMKQVFVLGDVSGERLVAGFYTRGSTKLLNSFIYGNINGNEDVTPIAQATNDQCFQYENQKINNEVISGEDLHIVTKAQLLDKKWYINTLKFDENIWDFEPLTRGYFPKLKNLDHQEDIEIK